MSQALAMSSFILSSDVVQASSAVVSGIAFIGMDNGRDSRKKQNASKKKQKKWSLLVVLHFPVLLITDLQIVKTLTDR